MSDFNLNSEQVMKNIGSDKQQLDKKKVDALINKLSPDQKKQLNNILGDKEATKKLLSSPQAQALLRSLSNGKSSKK